MRPEMLYLMEGDEWRDYLVQLLRSDEMQAVMDMHPSGDDLTRDDLADALLHHWRSKPNKAVERFWKANARALEIEMLVADGMSRREAKKTFVPEDSIDAHDRWMRRNLNPKGGQNRD